MNNALKTRIKAAEEKVVPQTGKELSLIICAPGEDPETRLKELPPTENDRLVLLLSFPHWGKDKPKANTPLTQEIRATVKELQQEGVSMDQIKAAIENVPIFVESIYSEPEEVKSETKEPEKFGGSEELVSLLGGRRRGKWSIDEG